MPITRLIFLLTLFVLIPVIEVSAQRLVPEIINHEPPTSDARGFGWGVAQDDLGLIYTIDHKNCLIWVYDGTSWSSFSTGSSFPVAMHHSNSGRIWIATTDGIGTVDRSSDGTFAYRPVPVPGLERHHFFSVEARRDGVVAFFSPHHRVLCNNDEELALFSCRSGETIVGNGDHGTYVVSLDDSELLIVDDSGHRKTYASVENCDEIAVVLELEKDRLILWRSDRFDVIHDGRVEPFSEELNSRVENGQDNLFLMPMLDGVAVGFYGEFLFLNADGSLRYRIGTDDGLPESLIARVRADRDGNLWLSHDDGISCVQHSNPIYRLCSANGRIANCLEIGRHANLLALFGVGKLLLFDDESATEAEHLELFPRSIELGENRLLVCTSSGIFRIVDDLGLELLECSKEVSSGVCLGDDRAMIGNLQGELLLVDLNGEMESKAVLQTDSPLYGLFLDSKGGVWGNLGGGLIAYFRNTDHDWNGKTEVEYLDIESTFGFASSSTPERVLIKQGDSFFDVSSEGGEITVSSIEDLDNEIESQIFLEGREIGVRAEGGSSRSASWTLPEPVVCAYLDRDTDRLIASTNHNVYCIDLNVEAGAEPLAPIFLRSANADSIVNASGTSSFNSFCFQFSVPSYNSFEPVVYRHKLNGLDSDFGEWSDQVLVEYSRLPPGSYSFEVEAKRGDEVVSAASREFVVPIPWYVQPLTLLGYLVAGTVFVFGLISWRTRSLAAANQQMEQLVEQRTEVVKRQKAEIESQAEKLVEQYRSAESDRLRSFDTLVAGIAHDFNNLLTVISMSNEVFLRRRENDLAQAAVPCGTLVAGS
ncbi:MAG: triple tyrosine motif-containing protein [Planctomycetota bacterium]